MCTLCPVVAVDSTCLCVVSHFPLWSVINADWFHSVFYNHLLQPQTLIQSFQIHAAAVLMRAQNPCYNNSGCQTKVFVLVMRWGGGLATMSVMLWTNKPLMAPLWVQNLSSFKNFIDEILYLLKYPPMMIIGLLWKLMSIFLCSAWVRGFHYH